jgi:hypothetical protein
VNTSSTPIDAGVYRERLQQAKRVMAALSEEERVNNFDITRYAVDSAHGVIGCIGGLCGLDPWFQERGFVTTVGCDMGSVSIEPHDFFGTGTPFFPSNYLPKTTVTVEDALVALDEAIKLFSEGDQT